MSTGSIHAASLSRDDLLPPARPAGMRRGLVLALIAHILLVLALAVGVNWRSSEPAGTDAELWAAVPQAAAPPAAEPPPTPPLSAPKPTPTPRVEPAPTPAKPLPDAQIAIDKEKQRKERQKKEEARQEQELKERREREREKKEQQLKREQLQQQQAAEKAQEEKKKKEKDAAEQKKKKQDAERELAQATAQREAQLQRILNQAGATGTGAPGSKGTAEKAAGPSASYGGRIIGAIRPNIVFPNDIAGNPAAEVEVRVGADGLILGRQLIKSSGVKEWDDAVLRAIDKTEKLPRDTDGRVAPRMLLVFKPKDLS